MNTIPPLNTSALMQQFGLKPDKNLGQNFLTDPEALQRILEIADLTSDDSVLEIGAGVGHLTRWLAANAEAVTAVELDKRLIPALQKVLENYPNTTILQGDILQLPVAEIIPADRYVVVANIPYYITSAIIRKLLEAGTRPSRIILTVQYEVAKRITATAGDLSVLALSILIYGEPYLTAKIPAASFHPPPRVDSAVIRIDLYPRPLLDDHLREVYFQLVKAGFQHRRKTLRNSLSAGLALPKSRVETFLKAADIDPGKRAQSLTLSQWIELSKQYDKIIQA